LIYLISIFEFAEEESLRVRSVTLVGESDFQLRVNQTELMSV